MSTGQGCCAVGVKRLKSVHRIPFEKLCAVTLMHDSQGCLLSHLEEAFASELDIHLPPQCMPRAHLIFLSKIVSFLGICMA